MRIPNFLKKIFVRSYAPSDDFWYTLPGLSTSSGVRVSEDDALKYLTVYSCVSLVGADMARLPLILYQRHPDGSKRRATEHYLYDKLHDRPNEDMSSFTWRESKQVHLMLWGNTYSFIDRQGEGKIKSLYPIPNPDQVEPCRGANGIEYKVTLENGKERIIPQWHMLHIANIGFSGLVGKSVISVAREAIGMGLATEKFGSKFFGEGTHPSAVFEVERPLGDKREEFIKHLRKQHAGLGKSHSIMVAEGGVKYRNVTMSPEDSQFLETRNFQKGEIAGMYHVPLHKIGVHGANSNYNNMEQENQSYVDSCLMHWIARWEGSFNHQLLTESERKQGYFFEFLMDGMLRGDSQARGEFYTKLFQVGAISPNEIRAKENMNPIEGGDQRFVQLNMVPLDQAGDIAAEKLVQPEPPKQIEEKQYVTVNVTPDMLGPPEKWPDGTVEDRSFKSLDRIATRHRPMFEKVAEEIVTLETRAIKREAKKQLKNRSKPTFINFLERFYSKHKIRIEDKFLPVLKLYMETVEAEVQRLTGDDKSLKDDPESWFEFQRFTKKLVQRFALKHCQSSEGQIRKLLESAEFRDALMLVIGRMDEWQEKRVKKMVDDELVRAKNAGVMERGILRGAKKKVWETRGKSDCPFCRVMKGKVVGIDREFIKDGAVLYVDHKTGEHSWYDPDTGKTPKAIGAVGTGENIAAMKFYGKKLHPPAHQGCDCYISTK